MSSSSHPSLTFLSVNVNGLGQKAKRLTLFSSLIDGPWSIIVLQKTHHIDEEQGIRWTRESAGDRRPWPGTCFWAAGTSGSRGVAIFFRNRVAFEDTTDFAPHSLTAPRQDTEGRLHLAAAGVDGGGCIQITHTCAADSSGARLDRWLVSTDILHHVRRTDVVVGLPGDHLGVEISVHTPAGQPRGPAPWTFPLQLLDDPVYKTELTELVQQTLQQHPVGPFPQPEVGRPQEGNQGPLHGVRPQREAETDSSGWGSEAKGHRGPQGLHSSPYGRLTPPQMAAGSQGASAAPT